MLDVGQEGTAEHDTVQACLIEEKEGLGNEEALEDTADMRVQRDSLLFASFHIKKRLPNVVAEVFRTPVQKGLLEQVLKQKRVGCAGDSKYRIYLHLVAPFSR